MVALAAEAFNHRGLKGATRLTEQRPAGDRGTGTEIAAGAAEHSQSAQLSGDTLTPMVGVDPDTVEEGTHVLQFVPEDAANQFVAHEGADALLSGAAKEGSLGKYVGVPILDGPVLRRRQPRRT